MFSSNLNYQMQLFIIPILLFLLHGETGETLNGIIVDKAGNALPGCNVIIKGTSRGAVTDVLWRILNCLTRGKICVDL